jgi:hypothetical protein
MGKVTSLVWDSALTLLLHEGPAKFTGHHDEEVPSVVLAVPTKGHYLSI